MRRSIEPWPRLRRPRFALVRDHARVAAESLAHVSHRLGTSFLVWLLIGIALALPAGLYLLERNLAVVADQWQGRAGFSIYFLADAPIADAEALAGTLRRDPVVATVRLVTPEEALNEFRTYADLNDALATLGSNPLPASIRATVREGVSMDALTEVARMAGSAPNVEEVIIEKTWLERLAAMSEAVRRLGWMLAVMFGLGAVLVTSASVRLAIESRLEDIRVSKLVGGTDGFLKRPFLYFGALYGLGGGVVAAMLLATVLLLLEPPLLAMFGSYGRNLELAGFDAVFLGGLLLVGALLGVIGAIIASNQRLASLEIV